MKQSLKRIRGAVVMGVIWAAVWAPAAVLIGTGIIDPDNSMDEMWVMVGAIPGFLSGVVFSAVLGVASRRRRLEELSISRVASWGAWAGLAIGILPFLIGDRGGRPVLPLAAVVITSFTLLSALSAAASLALAQRGQLPASLDESNDLASSGLAFGETHDHLPDGRTWKQSGSSSVDVRAPQHASMKSTG